MPDYATDTSAIILVVVLIGLFVLGMSLLGRTRRDADQIMRDYPDTQYADAAGCGKGFINLLIMAVVLAILLILAGSITPKI